MFIVFFGVSDLVRGDKRKDSKVIRSWSGQRLRLRCDVVHRHSIKPLFKWYRKPFTTNTIQDLFAPNNTKILIIEKINTTDFGEYYCEAKTRMVKVKQKFQVDKLGIENLVFVFCTIWLVEIGYLHNHPMQFELVVSDAFIWLIGHFNQFSVSFSKYSSIRRNWDPIIKLVNLTSISWLEY